MNGRILNNRRMAKENNGVVADNKAVGEANKEKDEMQKDRNMTN